MANATLRTIKLSDVREDDAVKLSDQKTVCFRVIGRDGDSVIITIEPFRVKLSDISHATGYRAGKTRLVGTYVGIFGHKDKG